MSLISLEKVSVRYGHFLALDNVSCEIDSGAVGILGPNGAGKSTLMKTLLGFNRASEGTVKLFDKSMPKNALPVRQQIGYMPERDASSPRISAVSFLTYLGQLSGMQRVDAMERTHEVLNYVGVGENRYRKMEMYSTGMLQRLKLAQALLHDPRLILLDEPTNGLDPEGRIEILDLIKEIAEKRDICILLSSHLLPDVQHVCDRVIMIKDGRIARDGSMAEMTAAQEKTYEVRLYDNKNAFLAALDQRGFAWKQDEQSHLHISCPDTATPDTLFEVAKEHNTHIRHFQPARSSLAETFMDAMATGATDGDKD